MPSHRPTRAARRGALAIALLWVLAAGLVACGDPEAAGPSPTTPPPPDGEQEPAGDSGGAAGGTRPAEISPAEALALDAGTPTVVRGHLHMSEGTWRLCPSLQESLPPQCPVDSLVVANPEAITEEDRAALQTAQGVSWSDAPVAYAGIRRGEDGFELQGPPDAGTEGMVGGDAAGEDTVDPPGPPTGE